MGNWFSVQNVKPQMVRLAASIAIMRCKRMPVIYRLILVMGLFDGWDRQLGNYFEGCNGGVCGWSGGDEGYQHIDKLFDIIIEFVVWYELKRQNLLEEFDSNILLAFILLRTAGVIAYLKTGNRRLLMFFPDVFGFAVYVSQLKCIPRGTGYALSLAAKLVQEYVMHGNTKYRDKKELTETDPPLLGLILDQNPLVVIPGEQ